MCGFFFCETRVSIPCSWKYFSNFKKQSELEANRYSATQENFYFTELDISFIYPKEPVSGSYSKSDDHIFSVHRSST